MLKRLTCLSISREVGSLEFVAACKLNNHTSPCQKYLISFSISHTDIGSSSRTNKTLQHPDTESLTFGSTENNALSGE